VGTKRRTSRDKAGEGGGKDTHIAENYNDTSAGQTKPNYCSMYTADYLLCFFFVILVQRILDNE
jgi:hypothetical protein